MGLLIYIFLGLVALSLLLIVAFFVWFLWQTRPRRPKEDGYPYVRVEEDGSAREVTAKERACLETKFHPTGGARPYIKLRYESVDRQGSIAGFLPRRQLPEEIAIVSVPFQ